MTLAEVMIGSLLAGFIILAGVGMYVNSIETWDHAAARLNVQREASLIVEGMMDEIREGSSVIVSNPGTSVRVYRRTGGADSLMNVYSFAGTELRNQSGVVLLDRISSLSFASPDQKKLIIRVRLEDDMGTTGLSEDDQGISIEAVAVCRNRG
jgi:hypothetical protein